MKHIDQILDELVDDAADTCSNDHGYMKSLLRRYFAQLTEDQQRKLHEDAFGPEMETYVLYVDIEGGCLRGIYGDTLPLPDETQILFVLRDHDEIKAGGADPMNDHPEPSKVAHYY